jgi:single stranded DNA-binding protein
VIRKCGTRRKGTAIANLGLAVNRVYTTEGGEQKEEVTFVDIEVWGRQAETAGQYLSKGKPVFVEGRLKLDSWEDKESGQKRNQAEGGCGARAIPGSIHGGRRSSKTRRRRTKRRRDRRAGVDARRRHRTGRGRGGADARGRGRQYTVLNGAVRTL